MTKVIHVHLIFEKKNYYFGSISAIFDTLSEEEVGITKNSLLHAGMTDGLGCRLFYARKYVFYRKEGHLEGHLEGHFSVFF